MTILSETFSYVILLGVSVYGITEYTHKCCQIFPFLYGTFLMTAIYASLGILKSGCKNCDDLKHIREVVLFLIPVIGLPLMISEVWSQHSMCLGGIKWLHLLTGLMITACKYGQDESNQSIPKETVDLAVGIYLLSLIGVGACNNDYYAVLSGLLFIMAHYGAKHDCARERSVLDMPSEDLYNYCLAGSVLCASLSQRYNNYQLQ